MRRAELEHIIRAAATVADDDELVIIGSQAVLGQFPDAPDEMLERTTLEQRLASTSLPDERLRAHLQALIVADFA